MIRITVLSLLCLSVEIGKISKEIKVHTGNIVQKYMKSKIMLMLKFCCYYYLNIDLMVISSRTLGDNPGQQKCELLNIFFGFYFKIKTFQMQVRSNELQKLTVF